MQYEKRLSRLIWTAQHESHTTVGNWIECRAAFGKGRGQQSSTFPPLLVLWDSLPDGFLLLLRHSSSRSDTTMPSWPLDPIRLSSGTSTTTGNTPAVLLPTLLSRIIMERCDFQPLPCSQGFEADDTFSFSLRQSSHYTLFIKPEQ